MHSLLSHPTLMDCRRLFLRNYEVWINIGVHDFEKRGEQRVLINVDLYIPLADVPRYRGSNDGPPQCLLLLIDRRAGLLDDLGSVGERIGEVHRQGDGRDAREALGVGGVEVHAATLGNRQHGPHRHPGAPGEPTARESGQGGC